MTHDVYRQKDRVVARKIADEMLLVPIKGTLADMDNVYVLDGTGEFIWERIDGNNSVDQLLSAVVAEFDVTEDQAASDLGELVRDLEEEALIERVAG